MATLRRKKAEPFSVFQRDPGPWPPILLNWMATLAIIMVFGLVMLFSASYTTGYLRFGDSFHYIKSQLLCTVLGLGMMFLFSYFDHRFLRRMVKLGYIVCLILLVLVLFSSPINGCRRWISFGGLTLQASEVAKFEMILLTAHLASSAPQIGRFRPSLKEKVRLKDWLFIRIVRQIILPVLPLVPVLVPLFISAFRRADELAMAMECRCYRGGDGRTRLKVLRCTKQDYIDLAFCIVCFAVILSSRWVFPNF